MSTKPHANQPGRYRSREGPQGWFVMLDYALRLAKGGAPLLHRPSPEGTRAVNTDPWVIWHPTSDSFIGFSNRKAATEALDELARGVDAGGLLSLIREVPAAAGESKQLPALSHTEEMSESAPASPARAGEVDYSREFMGALQERFPRELLFERLEDQMTATYQSAKQGALPDWSARGRALEMAFAYLIGRPIERQQIIQAKAPMSWESIVGLAQSSPVFRDTLLGMLEEMKKANPPQNNAHH